MTERRMASKPRGEVKMMLATPMTAQAVLDREYLEVRAQGPRARRPASTGSNGVVACRRTMLGSN